MIHRSAGRLIALCILLTAVLCDCSADKSFNAVVLSNTRGTLVIRPDEGSQEYKSSDKVTLSTEGVQVEDQAGAAFSGEDIQEGARLKIYYSGAIMESYPAQLTDCKRIVLLNT